MNAFWLETEAPKRRKSSKPINHNVNKNLIRPKCFIKLKHCHKQETRKRTEDLDKEIFCKTTTN